MKVGEAFDLKKGKKPNDLFSVRSGNRIRFIQIDDLRNDQNLKFCEQDKNNVLCSENDVVIAWDGANAGTVGWGLSGAIGSTLAVLSPKNKKDYYPPFVGRFISSKQNLLRERRIGATIPHLQRDSLVGLDLPKKSYTEQIEINQKLELIDTLLDKRRQSLAKLDQLAQSIFLDMFVYSKASQKWPEVKIEDLAADVPVAMRSGPFGSDLKHSEFVDEGVAVLGIDNVATNEFKWGERRFITEKKYQELKRYTIRPRDVLITIMATLGRTCVVPDDIPLSINTKHLAALTIDPNKASPYFISKAFLYHPDILGQLKVSEKGAIMAGLNLGIIKGIKLRIPPIDLQNLYEKRILKIREMRFKLIQSLNQVEELQQSLSQKFFGQ